MKDARLAKDALLAVVDIAYHALRSVPGAGHLRIGDTFRDHSSDSFVVWVTNGELGMSCRASKVTIPAKLLAYPLFPGIAIDRIRASFVEAARQLGFTGMRRVVAMQPRYGRRPAWMPTLVRIEARS